MSLAAACLCAAAALAQRPPTNTAEIAAQAELDALKTDGFIALQPWTQLLGRGELGVGWLTAGPGDGAVEWTQSFGADGGMWQTAWFSRDGLRQANGTSQRAEIKGYDPSKPLRFRARSRPITSFKPYKVEFGEPVTSREIRLPALTRPGGATSFIVLNDLHNHARFVPLLTAAAGPGIDFAVLNGDVLEDPQSEKTVTDALLSPMAWFASRSLPCFFLRGNHETRGSFARPLKNYLVLPGDRYYAAMTFGAARVVFLDCGEDKPDATPAYSGLVDFDAYMETEFAWLEREMETEAFTCAAWRLVVVHTPPDWRKGESKLWHVERRMRERFAPLFDRGGVTAVISGHNHKAEVVEPCPDKGRGFQWPVFIGGSIPAPNTTVIRVDADNNALAIRLIKADGTVQAERRWSLGTGGGL